MLLHGLFIILIFNKYIFYQVCVCVCVARAYLDYFKYFAIINNYAMNILISSFWIIS